MTPVPFSPIGREDMAENNFVANAVLTTDETVSAMR
jgi:hypothetical protein